MGAAPWHFNEELTFCTSRIFANKNQITNKLQFTKGCSDFRMLQKSAKIHRCFQKVMCIIAYCGFMFCKERERGDFKRNGIGDLSEADTFLGLTMPHTHRRVWGLNTAKYFSDPQQGNVALKAQNSVPLHRQSEWSRDRYSALYIGALGL